jgi:hypothetical protein
MYVNSNGNMGQAREQAQANADSSGVPWVIFKDSSGNLRVERQQSQQDVIEVVHPSKS